MYGNHKYSLEESRIINLQDSYTIMYAFIVRSMLDECGLEGEAAVREGTRRYGADRGIKSRQNHINMGEKVNMKNLFSLGFDLPTDPRFRRDRQELNPQERISHTLVCPMADVWKTIGEKDIGRIYCEEFHPACYGAYGYGYTQVNLARTLTQDGDDYCSFSVILRPENLPEELRPICFAEYDPNFVPPVIEEKCPDAKAGFNSLWVRLYYYLLEAADEQLGEAGCAAVGHGLGKLAADAASRMKNAAKERGLTCDKDFVHYNYPLSIDIDREPMWKEYNNHNAKELLRAAFYSVFFHELGFEV